MPHLPEEPHLRHVLERVGQRHDQRLYAWAVLQSQGECARDPGVGAAAVHYLLAEKVT